MHRLERGLSEREETASESPVEPEPELPDVLKSANANPATILRAE